MDKIKPGKKYVIYVMFAYTAISSNGNFNNGAELKIGDTSVLDAAKNPSVLVSFEPVEGGFLIENNGKYWNYTEGRDIVDKAIFIHLHRSKVITLQDKSKASVFKLGTVMEQGSQFYTILKGDEGISTKGGHDKGAPLVWSENYKKDDFGQNFYFDITEIKSGDNKKGLFVPDPNEEYILQIPKLNQGLIPSEMSYNFVEGKIPTIRYFGTLKEHQENFETNRYKITLESFVPDGFPNYKFYYHNITPLSYKQDNIILMPFFVAEENLDKYGGDIAIMDKDNNFSSGGRKYYTMIRETDKKGEFTISFEPDEEKSYYLNTTNGKEMDSAFVANKKVKPSPTTFNIIPTKKKIEEFKNVNLSFNFNWKLIILIVSLIIIVLATAFYISNTR